MQVAAEWKKTIQPPMSQESNPRCYFAPILNLSSGLVRTRQHRRRRLYTCHAYGRSRTSTLSSTSPPTLTHFLASILTSQQISTIPFLRAIRNLRPSTSPKRRLRTPPTRQYSLHLQTPYSSYKLRISDFVQPPVRKKIQLPSHTT